eukprot:XP_014774985.1 PREDICTED: A disintegrin and metalloproteinase with thrombospondin motifs 7-like [Octopus bimaculoides]
MTGLRITEKNVLYVVVLMSLTTGNFATRELFNEGFWYFNGFETLKSDNFTEFFLATVSSDSNPYNSGPSQISVNSSTKFLAIHTSQFSLLLDLWPPQSVIHPSAKVVVSDKNNEHEENIRFEPECFLSGKPQFGRGMVSLSYCNGLHGIIVTNGSDYQIIAPRSTCAENIYLIARRASSNLMQQVNKMEEARTTHEKLTIELALFYDQSVYNYLEEKTNSKSLKEKLQYLVAAWNTVQYEFNKENQLGYSIKLIIKYINIFRENPSWYKTNSFALALRSVCVWAEERKLNYDHIHIVTNSKNSNLLGLGGSGGICGGGRCAISKSIKWGDYDTLSHEIAHGIDIPHDGHPNCANYTGRSGVMGDRNTGWSVCAAKYFERWLKRGKGKCMQEENVSVSVTKGKTHSIVDTFGSGLLPATYTTPDDYCRIRYGKGFSYIDLYPKYKCGIISCAYLEKGNQYGRIRIDTGGTNGLSCGPQMVCRPNKRCESLNETNFWASAPVITGGWSAWSSYSPCDRKCGTGVTLSTRQCNNPKPVGTEWCRGSSVRAKLCNTHVQLRYFVQYPLRSIKGFDDLHRHFNVSPSECASLCLRNNDCHSFEYKREHRKCDLSTKTTSNQMLNVQEYWDLYILPSPVSDLFKYIPKHSIYGYDDLGRIFNATVEDCARECLKNRSCRSFEYKPQQSKCDLSTVTSKEKPITTKADWDHYEIDEDDKKIGKEGLCEVECDLTSQSNEGASGHIALMPDGTPCNINSQWRCLRGKCVVSILYSGLRCTAINTFKYQYLGSCFKTVCLGIHSIISETIVTRKFIFENI